MSQCLVVKKEKLEKTDFWQRIPHNADGKIFGMARLNAKEVDEFLKIIEENKEFKERHGDEGIENKPEWQQIIFYGLIRQGDKFFVYQRGGEGSSYVETRLHGKIAVGVGGHIEPFDTSLLDSLYRELDEEVIFKKNGQEINLKDFLNLAEIKIVALIKYETDEVGEVHLGLACEVNLLDPNLTVKVKEGENVRGQMMGLREYQNLVKTGKVIPEPWAQIVVEEINKEIKPPKGKERI